MPLGMSAGGLKRGLAEDRRPTLRMGRHTIAWDEAGLSKKEKGRIKQMGNGIRLFASCLQSQCDQLPHFPTAMPSLPWSPSNWDPKETLCCCLKIFIFFYVSVHAYRGQKGESDP